MTFFFMDKYDYTFVLQQYLINLTVTQFRKKETTSFNVLVGSNEYSIAVLH